eukprot:CCRYP_013712-RA/>CCRYP_013712-RA protein AED:0.39 eAED:0.38 QI:0/0/0/1/0/0/3/0/198
MAPTSDGAFVYVIVRSIGCQPSQSVAHQQGIQGITSSHMANTNLGRGGTTRLVRTHRHRPAACYHFWCTQGNRHHKSVDYPLVHILADNKTAEAWTRKGCKISLAGRALGRVQCALMMNIPPEDVNFLLATWAVDLLRGNNITGKHLRSATIGGYLQAAAALLKEGGYQFDPLDDQHNTHTKRILSSLRRYESIPNRR